MEKPNSRRIDTTLGDLIAAASEVAFEYSDNDKDAYNLAQLALMEMIKKTTHLIDLDKELENLAPLSQLLHSPPARRPDALAAALEANDVPVQRAAAEILSKSEDPARREAALAVLAKLRPRPAAAKPPAAKPQAKKK